MVYITIIFILIVLVFLMNREDITREEIKELKKDLRIRQDMHFNLSAKHRELFYRFSQLEDRINLEAELKLKKILKEMEESND